MNSNYDKNPTIKIKDYGHACWQGWDLICNQINSAIVECGNTRTILVVETYPGVNDEELTSALKQNIQIDAFYKANDAYLSETELDRLTYPDVTDDRIFGYMTRLTIEAFFDKNKLSEMQKSISQSQGLIVVYGVGASHVHLL